MTRMFQIPVAEYKKRLSTLADLMNKRNLGGAFLSSGVSMKYFTGFHYLQTERPAGIVVDRNGRAYFLGPKLEEEHSMYQSQVISEAFSYFDYPGKVHPFKHFGKWIEDIVPGKNIGVDNLSLYPGVYGFKGLSTQEVLRNLEPVDISSSIYEMRRIKSTAEHEVLRESARWANYAHRLLQEYAEPGKFDFEVASRASSAAAVAAMNTFGMDARPPIRYPMAIHAGFRGQVGTHSYYPHSVSINRKIKRGDILGSGADGNIDGYHVEIERNLFMGRVTAQIRKYHSVMVEMQQEAINNLKVGAKFSDIDKVVQSYAKLKDVSQLLLHHSGHCIGLEGHESPFFDIGDDSAIRSGMVFTIEPGIYVPKLGGFRHSDTVIMHEDGPEVITYYPSSIDDLVI